MNQSPRQKQIWILDDDAILVEVLQDMLNDSYDIRALTDSEKVIPLLEQGLRFDALLCDLMMPKMSGIEIYQRIQALYPGLERRIVFATGGLVTQHQRDFFASIANPKLEKPYHLSALNSALESVLEHAFTIGDHALPIVIDGASLDPSKENAGERIKTIG